MKKRIKQVKGHPITFTGMLFILFLGLKLTGSIDWGWVWIFSPIIFNVIFRLSELIVITNQKKIKKYEKEIKK